MNIQGNKQIQFNSPGDIARPLGSYEKLLSRTSPNSNMLSLSHGVVYLLSGIMNNNELLWSLQNCIDRHPMLRAGIFDEDGKKYWKISAESSTSIANSVLNTVQVSPIEFDSYWMTAYHSALNEASFDVNGPQWRLTNVVCNETKKSAWVFCVNHGIDDQQSINILVNDILINHSIDRSNASINNKPLKFPDSIETVVAPEWLGIRTMLWAVYQICNSLSFAAMKPKIIKNINNSIANPNKRKTFCKFFKLSTDDTKQLIKLSKLNKVTVTNVLSAAMLLITNLAIQNDVSPNQSNYEDIKLRFLLSVGLRPFASPNYIDQYSTVKSDFTDGSVACTGGAVDYIISQSSFVLKTLNNWFTLIDESKDSNDLDVEEFDLFKNMFWTLATETKHQADFIINKCQFVPESVRLFSFGMKTVDILQAVEIDARNKDSYGRGFSCGVSNVGVVPFHSKRDKAIEIIESYYATSHSRNGVLCQLSTMSINENLFGCLQFTNPIISDVEGEAFKNNLLKLLCNLM
eukprot:gene10295-13840_t